MPSQAPVVPAQSSAATSNPADLLDETEAAASLNVAVQTLRNWRWKGGEGLRYVKIGKRTVRYRRADVEAFIEAGTSGKVPA